MLSIYLTFLFVLKTFLFTFWLKLYTVFILITKNGPNFYHNEDPTPLLVEPDESASFNSSTANRRCSLIVSGLCTGDCVVFTGDCGFWGLPGPFATNIESGNGLEGDWSSSLTAKRSRCSSRFCGARRTAWLKSAYAIWRSPAAWWERARVWKAS